MKSIAVFLAALLNCISTYALADSCPPPSNSINPTISSSASFDKKTQLYTYKYSVKNGIDSQIPINFFILQINKAPSLVQSPNHWIGGFEPSTYLPNQVEWMSASKSADVRPGQSLSGFDIQSPQAPSAVQYFADGRTGVPSSSPPALGAADDEPMPNCPNWDFTGPRFQRIVSGVTTGPSNPNTISVAIRLRDEKAEHVCGEINPNSPSGKVSVLVLGSKTFDPDQIVTSSIKFGPNGASPLAAKLVPSGGENLASWDEHEEWEKLLKGIDADYDKNPKKQNLLLTFTQADLGIQCVLDKAVFLSGQTKDGASIFGSASTRLVGCDVKHPGKRAHKGHVGDGGD